MKLYNILNEVILEKKSLIVEVSRNEVIKAIDGKYRVNIYYAGDDNTAAGKRHIEVYAFGLSKDGNPVIRAYQVFGDTKTFVPRWKLFRLDRIMRWEPTEFRYYSPVSSRGTNIPSYNPSGDASMSTVYKLARF